jgi:hypothetical protein
LAVGNGDGGVDLWCGPKTWESEAARIANRNLSLDEWRQWIGLKVPYRRTFPELRPGEGAPPDSK